MTGQKRNSQKALLLEIFDQAFDERAWHGPNLRYSIRGLKIPQLLWRPAPGRHNIWEVVLHCAFWKHTVIQRITERKAGDFPRKPSDWPKLPESESAGDWKNDLRLLNEVHATLRQTILTIPENRLHVIPKGSKSPVIRQIYGITSHDLYHAGQIQLLKRLMKK